MRTCRRCGRDMAGERLNHKTVCLACQRATLKAHYKRVYAKRKAQKEENHE